MDDNRSKQGGESLERYHSAIGSTVWNGQV